MKRSAVLIVFRPFLRRLSRSFASGEKRTAIESAAGPKTKHEEEMEHLKASFAAMQPPQA